MSVLAKTKYVNNMYMLAVVESAWGLRPEILF